MKRKWKNYVAIVMAFALFATTVVCGVPTKVYAVESKEQVQAKVQGNVGEAPDEVNLTRSGEKDWVHFNNKNVELLERKNREKFLLDNIQLLGIPDNLARDAKTNFVYDDGTDQVTSPENNHIGLILNGLNNGVRFQVPGSTVQQKLKLYLGSWASEATVTVSVNSETVYEETYGKKETSSGAQCFEHEILYETTSEQDIVWVEIKTTAIYDQRWGNINIQAVTLADAGSETTVNAEVLPLENQPEIKLSEEGNVDWLYFNDVEITNYEYKNLEASYLRNVKSISSTGGLTGDKFAFFQYVDGSKKENNSSSFKTEKKGLSIIIREMV